MRLLFTISIVNETRITYLIQMLLKLSGKLISRQKETPKSFTTISVKMVMDGRTQTTIPPTTVRRLTRRLTVHHLTVRRLTVATV